MCAVAKVAHIINQVPILNMVVWCNGKYSKCLYSSYVVNHKVSGSNPGDNIKLQ